MIRIHADALKDYQICSLLYEYRHVKGLGADEYNHPRVRRQMDFEATIKKVVSFFFYKKQALATPSYQALLNRWQRLWFNSDVSAIDLATIQHEIMWDSETSYTTQAAMALLEFFNSFNKEDIQVLLIDEPFSVPLGKKAVLTGRFDLVTRKKTNIGYEYTVYKWSGFHKRPAPGFWAMDFAFLNYAFGYRNDFKRMNVTFKMWDFGSTKPGEIVMETTRHDLNTMKYWVEQITESDIHVPRRGLTAFCKGCPYDAPCSSWRFPEDKVV